jgi:glycosyltransferase involved in cell wall biosynthesis
VSDARKGRLFVGRLPLRSSERQRRMVGAAYLVVPDSGDEALLRRVLVEAFANGLPVIAGREGVAAELIQHGRNGLLFEPGSERELARCIAWAEAFPERMRQMGDCAKADYATRLVAHWSWHRLFGERRRSARRL